MADFGNAGKPVIRKDLLAVEVRSGETLTYTLDVSGAQGIFTFACDTRPGKAIRIIRRIKRNTHGRGNVLTMRTMEELPAAISTSRECFFSQPPPTRTK